MKLHLDNMNGSQLQRMYRQNDISSGEATTNRSRCRNTGHHGVFLAMHSSAPPPVEKYKEWMETRAIANNGGNRAPTPERLRRFVIMKRSGCSCGEIGKSFKMASASIRRWLELLPPELAA